MTQDTKLDRRRILQGALTASAAAGVVMSAGEAWAQTSPPPPTAQLRTGIVQVPVRVTTLNFNHSRIAGRAASLPAANSVDQLIGQIAGRTRLRTDQVHQVLSLAFQSVEQFVLRKYAANPQALTQQLGLIGNNGLAAIVAPV